MSITGGQPFIGRKGMEKMMDWRKIENAIKAIQNGIGKRIDLGNIIVYAVGKNVIRIDIKGQNLPD